MYCLQFCVTVSNAGPTPCPPGAPGAVTFESFLEKPTPKEAGTFIRIPPAMFLGGASNTLIVTNMAGTNIVITTNSVFTYPVDPPPTNLIFSYSGNPGFLDLSFVNISLNLIGARCLERRTRPNLY